MCNCSCGHVLISKYWIMWLLRGCCILRNIKKWHCCATLQNCSFDITCTNCKLQCNSHSIISLNRMWLSKNWLKKQRNISDSCMEWLTCTWAPLVIHRSEGWHGWEVAIGIVVVVVVVVVVVIVSSSSSISRSSFRSAAVTFLIDITAYFHRNY